MGLVNPLDVAVIVSSDPYGRKMSDYLLLKTDKTGYVCVVCQLHVVDMQPVR